MKETISVGTVIAIETAVEVTAEISPAGEGFEIRAEVSNVTSALNELADVVKKYPDVFKGVSIHEAQTVAYGSTRDTNRARIITGILPDRG